MDETSISLLDRLREPSDAPAWQQLVDLYKPLIRRWVARDGMQSADVDDLVQNVFAVVLCKLPDFRHNAHTGAFRTWLRLIVVNCLREFWRGRRYRPTATGDSDFLEELNQLEDATSGISRLWDQEHDLSVVHHALERIQDEFKPTTRLAFRRQVLEGRSPEAAAAELGISVNAAVIAKCRVLQRLRQQLHGLIDA